MPRINLESEDQARADFYALLARLYAAAPDAALLAAIAAAPPLAPEPGSTDANGIVAAWQSLRSASGLADATTAGRSFRRFSSVWEGAR